MAKPNKSIDRRVKIKVVGVGGAGTNAVDRLVMEGFQDVAILCVNTDTQHLAASVAAEKIQIGAQRTRGLGAGGDPKIGREAANEDEMELRQSLSGYDLVFLAAGMGGGTGTGAGPVIADIARQQGALVLSLVTLPFSSEGKHRCRIAREGLDSMRRAADAVICVPNDRLLSLAREETSVLDAFRPTDQFLCDGVKMIYSMLAKTGLINIDFADLAAVLRRERGETLVGYATGQGERRVESAMQAALRSPLLSQAEILQKAEAALVCMTYGPVTPMREVNQGMELLQSHLGEETAIKVGYVIDEAAADEVSVLVIASTGKAASRSAHGPVKRVTERAAPAAAPEPAEVSEPPVAIEAEPEIPAEPVAVGGGEPEAEPVLEAASAQRSAALAARQEDLPLDDASNSHFDRNDRVIVDGQDLDQPTYLRLGIKLRRQYR